MLRSRNSQRMQPLDSANDEICFSEALQAMELTHKDSRYIVSYTKLQEYASQRKCLFKSKLAYLSCKLTCGPRKRSVFSAAYFCYMFVYC